MNLEQTLDAMRVSTDRASVAFGGVLSRAYRGDEADALAKLAEAEKALRFALAGIEQARDLVRKGVPA